MTPEQIKTLKSLWTTDTPLVEVARRVRCRSTTASRWAARLGLPPRTAHKEAARRRWREKFMASLATRKPAFYGDDATGGALRVPDVSASYGKKQYEDDPRAVAECGGRPWRPTRLLADRSYVGCAAAMTAGN